MENQLTNCAPLMPSIDDMEWGSSSNENDQERAWWCDESHEVGLKGSHQIMCTQKKKSL